MNKKKPWILPEDTVLGADQPMPVQPGVPHRPECFVHRVSQHRHVFEVHPAAVLVEVKTDKGEIRVVVPQSLQMLTPILRRPFSYLGFVEGIMTFQEL